jgi:hypothetical protein
MNRTDFYNHSNQSNAIWYDVAVVQVATEKSLQPSIGFSENRTRKYNAIRKLLGITPVNHKHIRKSCSNSRSSSSSCIHHQQQQISQVPLATKSEQSKQLFDPVKMEELLALIRSEEFIGTIDPEYHSCYFVSDECRDEYAQEKHKSDHS